MDAERIFAKVKHHLMAIGTPVALKLRDAFIKRIKYQKDKTEAQSHTNTSYVLPSCPKLLEF